MHARVDHHDGVRCAGWQAFGKDAFFVEVDVPRCIGGGGQGVDIGHQRIFAGDDVDHFDAVTELIDGPIELVGLGENLF